MTKKREGVDFEKSIAELEALVERMESGELTLEQSLKDFERGVALTRLCQKALSDAEQKVKILLSRDGEAGLQAFEAADPDDNDKDE
ncbi:MAG: exodeoxyribonuclease VII small subunit [Gammaproteobacteria bacterium]|nr:exodeoxyribonuclease VII small subunit [Gammaproteobacteria bacterium]MCG3145566.1 Exodeoxyribonuclease 7 small subunit [Gammaproteobacteria bacterium]